MVQSWVYWEFGCVDLDCVKPQCDHLQLWRRKFLLYFFLLNNQLCLHPACILGFKVLWSVKWHAPEDVPMEIWFTPPKSLTISARIRKRLRIWLIGYSASLSDGGQLTCSSKYKWNGLEFLPWVVEVLLVISSATALGRSSSVKKQKCGKTHRESQPGHQTAEENFWKLSQIAFYFPVLTVIPGK